MKKFVLDEVDIWYVDEDGKRLQWCGRVGGGRTIRDLAEKVVRLLNEEEGKKEDDQHAKG